MMSVMRGKASVLVMALVVSACSADLAEPPRDATQAPAEEAAPTAVPVAATTTSLPLTGSSSAPSTSSTIPPTTGAPATTAPTATTGDTDFAGPEEPETTEVTPVPLRYAGVGDSLYPLLGNRGYDVRHYDVKLDVDPVRNRIKGSTTIEAVATRNIGRFHLDFSGMEVHSVVVNGRDTEFQRQGSELIVWPEGVLRDGTAFVTTVAYSGTPERIADPGVPFARIGWFSVDEMIFTAGEPSGAMTWFPSNNHPSDKARFIFRLTVPAEFQVAATGRFDGEFVFGGTRDVTWVMPDEMATYLAAVYIGDFDRHEQHSRDGLLIRDFVPRQFGDAETEETLDALSITPGAIEFFEELLGPYPFDAYGTFVLPFRLGFALENQTLSLHGTRTLTPQIIAHELAHQWFGNSVTLSDWSEIWLHEGFAHYLSLVYLAEVHGEPLDARMARELESVMLSGAGSPMNISVEQLFDIDIVYRRGALALHALHRYVGDGVFFDILRYHHQRAAGGNTSTAEFLAVVELIGGPRSVDVITPWLYDEQVPTEFDRSEG